MSSPTLDVGTKGYQAEHCSFTSSKGAPLLREWRSGHPDKMRSLGFLGSECLLVLPMTPRVKVTKICSETIENLRASPGLQRPTEFRSDSPFPAKLSPTDCGVTGNWGVR